MIFTEKYLEPTKAIVETLTGEKVNVFCDGDGVCVELNSNKDVFSTYDYEWINSTNDMDNIWSIVKDFIYEYSMYNLHKTDEK